MHIAWVFRRIFRTKITKRQAPVPQALSGRKRGPEMTSTSGCCRVTADGSSACRNSKDPDNLALCAFIVSPPWRFGQCDNESNPSVKAAGCLPSEKKSKRFVRLVHVQTQAAPPSRGPPVQASSSPTKRNSHFTAPRSVKLVAICRSSSCIGLRHSRMTRKAWDELGFWSD